MRLIATEYLKEGFVPVGNIYDSKGNVLVRAGISLKQKYIDELKFKYKISYIFVEDPRTDEIVINQFVSDELRFEALRRIKEALNNIRNSPAGGADIDYSKFESIVKEYINSIYSVAAADYNFMDIKPYDDYTSAHSVNVMLLSILSGMAANYSNIQIERLGLSGLLHDLGKGRIPLEILEKPDKLTAQEFELMKKHSELGYEIVKDSVHRSVAEGVRYHHERADGSGYPAGLNGDNIGIFAKNISVCDVYDAITSDRVYKNRVLPDIALGIIKSSKNQFDPDAVAHFLKFIIPYPKGTPVMLSNKLNGVVKKININNRSRPVVKILQDENGDEVVPFFDIDLSKEKDLSILRVIGDV